MKNVRFIDLGNVRLRSARKGKGSLLRLPGVLIAG